VNPNTNQNVKMYKNGGSEERRGGSEERRGGSEERRGGSEERRGGSEERRGGSWANCRKRNVICSAADCFTDQAAVPSCGFVTFVLL
jgi:hypothetical protein